MNTYSGKFVLRLGSDLHKSLSTEAATKGQSLNEYCSSILENRKSISQPGPYFKNQSQTIKILQNKFGQSLKAIILFGSTARNESTKSSDIDLLVVLKSDTPINRKLYTWWCDNEIKSEKPINLHFCTVPDSVRSVGSLWLEVAIDGHILFEEGSTVSQKIKKIYQLIEDGIVQKYYSHGHPYWKWTTNEEHSSH